MAEIRRQCQCECVASALLARGQSRKTAPAAMADNLPMAKGREYLPCTAACHFGPDSSTRFSMRLLIVARILGPLTIVLGITLLVPAAVGLLYGESDWRVFAVLAAA